MIITKESLTLLKSKNLSYLIIRGDEIELQYMLPLGKTQQVYHVEYTPVDICFTGFYAGDPERVCIGFAVHDHYATEITTLLAFLKESDDLSINIDLNAAQQYTRHALVPETCLHSKGYELVGYEIRAIVSRKNKQFSFLLERDYQPLNSAFPVQWTLKQDFRTLDELKDWLKSK